jgi:hypothetical protein
MLNLLVPDLSFDLTSLDLLKAVVSETNCSNSSVCTSVLIFISVEEGLLWKGKRTMEEGRRGLERGIRRVDIIQV